MTGAQLAEIRRELCGTDAVAFGRMLGLQGKDASVAASLRRLETRETISEWFAIIARDLKRKKGTGAADGL
jgi:hypothetical protein